MNFTEIHSQLMKAMETDRMFTVQPTHWWGWLNPAFYRRRRILQAWIDSQQEQFMAQYREEICNAMIYGTSTIKLFTEDETGPTEK